MKVSTLGNWDVLQSKSLVSPLLVDAVESFDQNQCLPLIVVGGLRNW